MSPVACLLVVGTSSEEGRPSAAPLCATPDASSSDPIGGVGAVQKTYTIGDRTFVLDQAKAEAALAAKRVVGGRETMTFNLLPLRYGWAYELYRTMKANHWEPEDVPMQRDIEQWRGDAALSDIDRWIVRMGIGYFSAAEGIVGDNVLHVVRELVTASELKLVLGRHAHEENIHADSLLYMISSLGIDPHECEAMFDDIPTIVAKNEFVTRVSRELRRDLDMTTRREQAAAGQEHLRVRPVHGGHAVLRAVRDDPVALPAGQAARHRHDVPLHAAGRVQPHRALPAAAAGAGRREPGDLDAGVPRGAARADARGGRAREALHPRLPAGRRASGSRATEFERYIDYIADRRLEGVGLAPLIGAASRTRCPGWPS